MLNKEQEQMIDFFKKVNGVDMHPQVFNKFISAKKEFLFDLFGDNLIHEMDIEYEKTTRQIISEISEEESFLELLRNSLDSEFRECAMFDQFNFYTGEYLVQQLVTKAKNLAYKTFDYDFTVMLKDNTLFKIQKGTKMTKVLRKVITDPEKLDIILNRYSEFFTSAKIKGKLCLSIHPLDYLTVSSNQNGWSSCFNIFRDGEYQASVLSLLSSPNTMVAYIKSNKEPEGVFYPEMNRYWNSKKWRTLVTLSSDLETCHMGKQYPNNIGEDGLKLILNAVSELTGKDYCHQKENGSHLLEICAPNNFYNDAQEEGGGCIKCGYTSDSPLNYDVFCTIDISLEGAFCISCGSEHKDGSGSLCCGDCGGHKLIECVECGDTGHLEQMIEADGEYYCNYCYYDLSCTCYNCSSIELETSGLYLNIRENGIMVEKFFCVDCADSL